jgi:hypothetical protein
LGLNAKTTELFHRIDLEALSNSTGKKAKVLIAYNLDTANAEALDNL